MKKYWWISWMFCAMFLTSCDFLFGRKDDDAVKDILTQGAIDPNLVPNTVGYVPVG